MERKYWGSRIGIYSQRTTTVFVDNLPDSIRKIWVYNLFSRFGKIRDLFIPAKKSKITGRKFGFVRFFSVKDAEMAIETVKDSWYWEHRLVVKFARFLRKEDEQGSQRYFNNQWKQNQQFMHANEWSQKQQKSSYAKRGKEVWRRKGIEESSKQGELRNVKTSDFVTKEHMGSVTVQPAGNGWLFRSAIAKISKLISTEDLEYVFNMVGAHKVQIKAIGGRHVIITFPDMIIRDSVIKEKWIANWFEEIKPWEGEQAYAERFVWLSCYGMPLNAWAFPTFKEIGNKWGQFLQVDESTLKGTSYVCAKILIATNQFHKVEGCLDLIVDKVKYSINVIEDYSFRYIKQSFVDISSELAMNKYSSNEEDDDKEAKNGDVEIIADVESKYGAQDVLCNDDVDNSNNNLVAANKPTLLIDKAAEVVESLSSSLGIGKSIVDSEIVADSMGEIPIDSQPLALNSDGLETQEASILNVLNKNDSNYVADSEAEECTEEGNKDLENPICNLIGRYEAKEPTKDLVEANKNPINAAIKGIQGKRNRKNIDEILGFSKVSAGNKGKKNKKCVVLRSAVAKAALSASISSEGINNRNRLLLNEAQAIWTVDKIMGLSYDGDENEVISKIAEMEALNKQRAICQS